MVSMARRARSPGLKSFLRALLRLTNAVLLVGGLATALFAFHLWLGFNKRRAGWDVDDDAWGAKSPPPSPPPPMEENASNVDAVKARVHSFFETEPWFLYFIGGSGGYAALTAWLGLAGAENANACCLGVYAYQVGFMVLLQAALVAYCSSGQAFRSVPRDITGEQAHAWELIKEHQNAVTALMLVLFFVQILSIILAIALRRAALASAGVDSDDEDDDYYVDKYGLDRERAPLVGNTSSDGAWRTRMREKYGLDTADFEHSPSRPPPSRVDRDRQRERDSQACVIM